MPLDDTEVIDLTQDSPISKQQHFIELDSDGEVIGDDPKPPTSNGKTNGRKRKKPRKKKAKDLEEGEVTQTSVDASREQSPDREKMSGESSSRLGASRDASSQVTGVKSLSDRLSSPGAKVSGIGNRHGRDDDVPAEKSRRPRIRRNRYVDPPPPKDDTRRRSRSPDRLRNSRDPLSSGRQPRIRQDGDPGRRSPERSAREPQPDNLFFEDVVRADVPTTVRVQEKPSQPAHPAEVPDEPSATLLLPAHVSVLDQGASVDQQQPAPLPASDSEDEDYIEYLDYDDDRRVRLASFAYMRC